MRTTLAVAILLLSLTACGEKAKPSPVKVGLQPNAPAAPESPPKSVSRADIETSIKQFTQKLGERYRTDPKWVQRFKAGEPESVNEILRPVLKENHLTQEEYEWAIDQTEELAKMQEKWISDAILGPIDPAKESLGAKKPE